MGEKGQPTTSQSPATAGGVPLQQGVVQRDSDWATTRGIAGSTVRVPLQQGAVQQDSDWAGQYPANPSGEKGQTGTDLMGNMNLQNELQKASQAQQDLSSVAKDMSDAAEAMIRKEGA